MERKYRVGGMMCAHCASSVERAISSLAGVESVKVDLPSGIVVIAGSVSTEQIVEAIENTGFDYLSEEN